MSDTEGSECEGCRWTRNEMAKIRAKLEKAEALAEVANKLYQACPLEQDGHYYSLNKALREYRGEKLELLIRKQGTPI